MVINTTKSRFIPAWLSAIGLYVVLTSLSLIFEPYRVFPAYGVVGYTAVIFMLLYAISQAEKRWNFILIGLTLVLAGVLASIDIVLSRSDIIQELRNLDSAWAQRLFHDDATVGNMVNVLVILLNIFTSSLAADVLFHGLNRRNFHAT